MTQKFTKSLLFAFICLVLSCKGFKKSAWLTPYRASVRSVSAAVAQLQKLRGLGVSRLYVDGFANGFLYAKSATWDSVVGNQNQPDHIQTLCTAAQQVGGFEIVAWLEFGLRASESGFPRPLRSGRSEERLAARQERRILLDEPFKGRLQTVLHQRREGGQRELQQISVLQGNPAR